MQQSTTLIRFTRDIILGVVILGFFINGIENQIHVPLFVNFAGGIITLTTMLAIDITSKKARIVIISFGCIALFVTLIVSMLIPGQKPLPVTSIPPTLTPTIIGIATFTSSPPTMIVLSTPIATSTSTSAINPAQRLLTANDMEQEVGDSWSAGVLSTQFPCPSFPSNISQLPNRELTSTSGAVLGEVIEVYPNDSSATQAYENFVSATDGCHVNVSQTYQIMVVRDNNPQNYDSSSTLWEIQGGNTGILAGGTPVHGGGVIAVRASNIVAFAWISVDINNLPDQPTIEQKILPTLAKRLVLPNG